jgi:hypothetical protein
VLTVDQIASSRSVSSASLVVAVLASAAVMISESGSMAMWAL